ncbi:GNAT family protein [Rhodococcus sp. IEGM 1409]|uniref:GNAT family N-acetyltransferase n=1 Tax=Rhodococcus sp. IEGM 1409 TaxID=3047082 RepID=UPI0024B75B59|nr:GNAT family protein [Rhodococcus sp. IEGM 1409]MDI9903412.1 GNAT family protein [Rhodococcus sp. IEGM 1409]
MFTLTTERLVLRDFTPEDEEAVHEYASDPAVCRYVDWGPNAPAVTRAFLADAALEAGFVERRSFTLAITSRADGAVIGSVAAWEVSAAHRRAELGFVVNPKFQGQGYASEAGRAVLELACSRLGAQRVQATCRPENSASASVLAKIGMVEEGLMRAHMVIRGTAVDSLLFAAVRAEITSPDFA